MTRPSSILRLLGRLGLGILLVGLTAVTARAQNILLLDNSCGGSLSPFPAALSDLGLGFTRTFSSSAFEARLLDGTSWDLLIVDVYGTTVLPSTQTAMIGYIADGGKVYMNYWSWNTTLAAAFEATLLGRYTAPLTLHRWDAAHPLFNLLHAVPDLVPTLNPCGFDGAIFDAAAGGVAIGGSAPSPTAGEAGVILGNGGRTLLFGGILGLFTGDADTDGEPDMEELAENAVLLLLGAEPPPPPVADLSIVKDDGRVDVLSGEQLTYTVTVRNEGPADVVNARVRDVFPRQLTEVSWTCAASGGASCALPEPVAEAEPNNSVLTAQDLDGERWSLAPDVNIADSTTVPHLTVTGSGDGTFDHYAFTVANAGDRGTFDIDFGAGAGGSMDSYLRLYNSGGLLLAQNDDSSTASGGAGSTSRLDSFLSFVFPAPGVYVIEVGRCCIGPVPTGGTYLLQISVDNHPVRSDAVGDIDTTVDLPSGGSVIFTASARIRRTALAGALTNVATVTAPLPTADPDPDNNRSVDVDNILAVFTQGRIVYLGIDPSEATHAAKPQARILAGNAARWAGGGVDQPRVAWVDGIGAFSSEVGVRLAEAGLTDLTEIQAASLASADLSAFDVVYVGPTSDVSGLVPALLNLVRFGNSGGGLVVEPNLQDPESWSWVPFADLIGHSGPVNVGSELVVITNPGHPVASGLTNDGLSDWGMSVHTVFSTPDAAGFEAVAADSYQFGTPVILVRNPVDPIIFTAGFDSGGTSGWTTVIP